MMPRTKTAAKSQFRTSLAGALQNVKDSLFRFGMDSGKKVESIVISSNVTLGENNPSDPGVAVWFVWDGLSVCIPIDRYPKVADNLQAIHLVIEARRAELRHGGLHIVKATFTGFAALPAPSSHRSWREVLEINFGSVRVHDIEMAYRKLAKIRHPDTGGTEGAMAELNRARDEALKEIGDA